MSEDKKSWAITWYDSNSATILTVHDKTRAEAEESAMALGYKRPKWWEIFKRIDFQFIEITC